MIMHTNIHRAAAFGIVAFMGLMAVASAQERCFQMGFTSWPYDCTLDAIDDTYVKIQDHGDIVAMHFEGGVPWPEAYSGQPYNQSVENEIAGRLSRLDAGMDVYLVLDSLNVEHTGIARYWGASENMTLPSPWNTYTFANQEVRTAYANWALDMIDRFEPTYFLYGLECTEFLLNNPAQWSNFVGFGQYVYTQIKNAYPSLPVGVSIALKHPNSPEMQAVQTNFASILPYIDYAGASTYAYAFYWPYRSGNSSGLPVDWLTQMTTLAPNKPLALTETGWIAEDLSIPEYSLYATGTAAWQNDYVANVFNEAQYLNMDFVIWWVIVDYDLLWTNCIGQDPLSKIWRDTGLYDGSVQARASLSTWDTWLGRTYNPSSTGGSVGELLFHDGFESGNLTAGGWSTTGSPRVISNYKTLGAYAVELTWTDTMTKSLSTAGKSNIRVSYSRMTRNWSTKHVYVEWYNGSTWQLIEDINANMGWGHVWFDLPAGAANNPNFRVRFRAAMKFCCDYCYIDEFRIESMP